MNAEDVGERVRQLREKVRTPEHQEAVRRLHDAHPGHEPNPVVLADATLADEDIAAIKERTEALLKGKGVVPHRG